MAARMVENEVIIKEGKMVKRSQNKKLFTSTNYKLRWFVLTSSHLIYFDCDSEKRRKEKGRVCLRSIKVIEAVMDNLLDNKPNAFQVGYEDYILYILANSDIERQEWIQAIRKVVRDNMDLSHKFHTGAFCGSRWTCCGSLSKVSSGCEPVTWNIMQPQNNNDCGGHDISAMQVGDAPMLVKPSDKKMSARVLVAVFPFKALEAGDLSLQKGETYEVVDDSKEHWWKVRDKHGNIGYIPSNYVKEEESTGLSLYDWYVGDMSRQRAESMLNYADKEGCFVVRNSSTRGMYTLSLFTKIPRSQVKHYHIKQTSTGQYYLSEKHCCASIPDLIHYHSHNSGGLATRLRHPPNHEPPPTVGLSHDKWEIDPSELTLLEELGSGQFGVVRRGKWRGSIDVAVKMMREGSMSEDDFVAEAKTMTRLQHGNLVQLYGVCTKHRPIYIVTEYMKNGSLLQYLRRHEAQLIRNTGLLLDICLQVCKGMSYLERHNYIHRDLAARNCLVGTENTVKVADFGLARYVLDDEYTSSGGAKFPIKWAPPEVLHYTRFSSKSDVWAYGVLMWEVFTCGSMPYGKLKNADVVSRVQRGELLEKPQFCPHVVFEVMQSCWRQNAEERPAFRELKEDLVNMQNFQEHEGS